MTEREAGNHAAARHDLQRHWKEAYLITGASGHWIAHRRDNGQALVASGPGELRGLIIEDYAAHPIRRGTERRGSA